MTMQERMKAFLADVFPYLVPSSPEMLWYGIFAVVVIIVMVGTVAAATYKPKHIPRTTPRYPRALPKADVDAYLIAARDPQSDHILIDSITSLEIARAHEASRLIGTSIEERRRARRKKQEEERRRIDDAQTTPDTTNAMLIHHTMTQASLLDASTPSPSSNYGSPSSSSNRSSSSRIDYDSSPSSSSSSSDSSSSSSD